MAAARSSYHWPGNVRELENIVRQLVLLGEDAGVLDNLLAFRRPTARTESPGREADVAPSPPPSPAPASEELGLAVIAERARQGAERHAIERALAITRWRRTEAARLLKISYLDAPAQDAGVRSRLTLGLRKMREYDLG